MFFEGSEKKAEIIVDGKQLSLLNDISDDFWAEMVACCDAQILSSISNPQCKAFLLSESSLFVWDDRLVILTCGRTRLVLAVEYFLTKIDQALVLHTIYQRKNEYFAHAQHSNFIDDAKLLGGKIQGQAYLFGELHGHHHYLYHLDNDYKADNSDKTYELLVYQISSNASATLTRDGLQRDDLRAFFCIDQLLPVFLIDDFVFEPFGYSLNAIRDNKYLTIHVTPQTISSYVSFESNINLVQLLPLLLNILSPGAFDLITYNESGFASLAADHVPTGFVCKKSVEGSLDNGYIVNFASYIKPQANVVEPLKLNLSGDANVF